MQELQLGDVIREKLQTRNMTQREFSKQIGISTTYLSQILNGQRALAPNSDVLKQIKTVLGICSVSDEPVETAYNRLYAEYLGGKRSVQDIIADVDNLKCRTTDNTSLHARVLLLLCRLCLDARWLREGIKAGVEAQTLFTELGDRFSWVTTIFYVASIELTGNGHECALARFLLVESELVRLKYVGDLLSRTYCAIARCYSAKGQYDLMYSYIKMCEDIIAEDIPPSERATYIAHKSYLFACSLLENGYYSDASEEFKRAKIEYEYVNDYQSALAMAHNIAEVYYRAGEVDKAYDMYLQVYNKYDKDSSRIVYTSNMLARINLERGNYAESLKYCEKILAMSDVSTREHARALLIKAHVEYETKGLSAFNHSMRLAMQKLDTKDSLMNEIVREYALKNDLPIGV